jgi:hypothetical protein
MKATRFGALALAAAVALGVTASTAGTAAADTSYNPTVRSGSVIALSGTYQVPAPGVPPALTNPAVICGYAGYSRATTYAQADGSYLPTQCIRSTAYQGEPSPVGGR